MGDNKDLETQVAEENVEKKKSTKAKTSKKDPEKKVKTVESDGVALDETEVTATPKKKTASTTAKTSRRSANTKALELELEKQKALSQEYQDKYKRLLAEFENARAREAAQASKMYDIGAKEILEKLLPVVDNFERAIDAIPESDKERAFESGVVAIYKQMMVSLEGVGVKSMDAEGKEFDPNLHNAVMHVEDDSVGDNIVVEEMQKGYMYKDQVLRHSMVKVAN